MNLFEKFNNRVMRGTTNSKELKTLQMRESFNKYLGSCPTGITIPITNPECFPSLTPIEGYDIGICHEEEIIVNDIVYNDKKALDEKYIKVRHDSQVDIGCYFYMDKSWWLIQFKDHKEIDCYKRFTARRCNQIIRYYDDEVLFDLPVSIENLTMYADGLAMLKYNTTLDSKRHIWYGSNPISRKLKIGMRVMLTGQTVFMATHINDFEYNSEVGRPGLLKTLVSQCDLIDKDDLENNIAWNDKTDVIDYNYKEIIGNIKVSIGSETTYTSNVDNDLENPENCTWELDKRYSYVKIVNQNATSCKIKVEKDISNIGEKFKLLLKDSKGDTINQLEILVKGV